MTKSRAILLVVILIAFFLRVWRLPQLPPGLWYDEAYNVMDARWVAETGQYPLFFVGNNGREPMWHYLVLLSTSLLGNTTFAPRLVGAFAGVLAIPIIYCFALIVLRPLSRGNQHPRWLAIVAAGLLAVSWWHLLNSRAGFRPILLPPLLMLSLYFFWRGCLSIKVRNSKPKTRNFILAGIFLGLTQYTYLPARLTPLIFGGLLILWTVQALMSDKKIQPPVFGFQLSVIPRLWLGLFITAIVAVIIFAPLGLFFLNNPETFSSRTGDVVIIPDTPGEVVSHLFQAISLFLGAGHDLYRHHWPGRAMLGWLEIPFFWFGLVVLLTSAYRRLPEAHLLLLGLGITWLPALLASPPVHSLRPIGMLPFYYLIVTLGLYHASYITSLTLHSRALGGVHATRFFYVLPVIIIALNGLLNGYDYFWRWANQPEVYQEFNGPLVDLTEHLIDLTQTTDVIIPLHIYLHPSTRYLLGNNFQEIDGPLPPGRRPVEILLVPSAFQLLYVANIPESPALALLTRDKTGQGTVYISRPPRADEQIEINALLDLSSQTQVIPFKDRLGRELAQFVSLTNNSAFRPLFDPTPLRTVELTWGVDKPSARLDGYDVTPELAVPNEPITLNFYWRSLTDTTFEYRLFLQLIDGAGKPITQWEGDAFREDMYRWRPAGILATQHTLWIGPDTLPGPYLVRLGFFDQHTGERLPLRIGESTNRQIGEWANQEVNDGVAPIDQVQLGLFYVTTDGSDPRLPATPLAATFGDAIKLIGVTVPEIQSAADGTPAKLETQNSRLHTTFHWQALRPTGKPYTVFLQLLNERDEVVASWDSQPFGGLYPTNLWSPDEVIADTFLLPLPEAGLPPGTYRLITGFYDFDTGQRLPVTGDSGSSDFTELLKFIVN